VRSGHGILLVALILLSLTAGGCHFFPWSPKYVVIVDVPVKPKFVPPGNVKEADVHQFEGAPECARDLQGGVQAEAIKGGFTRPIPGLPDLDGPLDIHGRVDVCSLRMGYGALNATMTLSHGGNVWHQEVVKEETNRPGASTEEVRATLVDRVITKFSSIFLPGVKREIRELRPLGGNDPGWVACKEKNWKFAVENWTTRIGEDPKEDRAWYNRGVAREGLGDVRAAVADYKKAVELDRDDLYVQALVHAERIAQDLVVIEAARKARE